MSSYTTLQSSHPLIDKRQNEKCRPSAGDKKGGGKHKCWHSSLWVASQLKGLTLLTSEDPVEQGMEDLAMNNNYGSKLKEFYLERSNFIFWVLLLEGWEFCWRRWLIQQKHNRTFELQHTSVLTFRALTFCLIKPSSQATPSIEGAFIKPKCKMDGNHFNELHATWFKASKRKIQTNSKLRWSSLYVVYHIVFCSPDF